MMERGDYIKIPNQLLAAFAKRRCIFFIGSGLSIDARLPSGNDIAGELHKILSKNGYSKGIQPLYKIAQDFENLRGRPDLVNIIKAIISQKLNQADKKSYSILSQVKPQPIDLITTNWDKLIEDSYGRDNINVIIEDVSLSTSYKTEMPNLLKIHGDLDNMLKATITENDYAKFKEDHPGFYDKISTAFRESTILFIGYSTEDWDFLEIFLKIKEELQKNVNPRYCVTPDDSPEFLARCQNLGIRHIKATARDFLLDLKEQLEGQEGEPSILFKEHPKFPDPRLPEVVKRNPFVVFRAEDMTDQLWQSELFREPKMYNIFADAVSPGNTIIEGHRGSGKSMILLYLSYPIQRLLGKNPDFVGAYIKLDLPLFATTRRRGEEKDEWVNYFLGYFNLIVAEGIIRMLNDCITKSWINVQNISKLLDKLMHLFPFVDGNKIETLVDLADSIYEKRNALVGPPPRESIKLPPDLIKSLIERIRRFVEEWKELPFYVFLDEYERLDEDQQKVVNLLLASRGPTYRERVYFKIATKSFLLVLEDIEGNQLEIVDDFLPIILDRFDLDEERKHKYYQKYIEDIANWRLQSIWKYGISIKKFLPKEKDENKKGFKNRDYSGFENIVNLSSFLPRDFLELCKDMVFYSYPNLLAEPKRADMKPISPNLQNTVIKIHADNLFENLNRITDEEERPLPKTRGENARRLVESWGKIFKRILEGSFKRILEGSEREYRTVSEFQIRNPSNLRIEALNALNDCTLRRTLVVPLTRRAPQIRKNIPADRYELHRLLCARIGLSLARRWPREVDAELINKLIESENPQEVIDELTRRFWEEDEAQRTILDFGGEI